MRHKKAFQKLGRKAPHRKALFRNLATSLILHDSIRTTVVKAKELKRIADKLVTLGKTDTLHNRRQAMSYLFAINQEQTGNAKKLTAVHRLFTEIAPKFAARNGGYTRVVRIGVRPGDCTEMAVIQFVEGEVTKSGKKPQRRTRKVVKAKTEVAATTE